MTSHIPETVAARAAGVLFAASFGSLWMTMGLAAIGRLNLLSGALVLAVLTTLVLSALCLRRRAAGHITTTRDEAADRQLKRSFQRVNAAQYVAIPFVILGMNLLHRPQWIAPGIAIIVGLHLFPLARLFRNPAHNLTGSALIAWAIYTMAMLPLAAVPSCSAVGTAAILWLSATYHLLVSRSSLATVAAEAQPA